MKRYTIDQFEKKLNQVHRCDYLKALQVVPESSIDLVIADPPYRFNSKGGGFYDPDYDKRRKYNDELENLACTKFKPSQFLIALKPVMKKFYGYFFCNKVLLDEYIGFAKSNKFNFDILVMAKTNPIPAYNNHHLSDLEYIVMVREKGTYFSKHREIDDFRKFYLTSCKKESHPAQKPLELIERFVRVSSKEGDIVLDPFMGSGTTAVACKKLKRNFIGFDISEKCCETTRKRLGR